VGEIKSFSLQTFSEYYYSFTTSPGSHFDGFLDGLRIELKSTVNTLGVQKNVAVVDFGCCSSAGSCAM
jgi:hypothetical protein